MHGGGVVTRRIVALGVLVTAVVVGLAACGGSGGGAGEAVTSEAASTTTTRAATSTTATSTTAAAPGAGAGTQAGGPVRHVSEITAFRSPSGNIGCYIAPDSARCDIRDRNWTPPAPPADCDLDYGQGVEVTPTGPASLVCAGDTAFDPTSPALAYGESIQAGVIRCTSSESGMDCTSTTSGHGFTISREAYRVT